MGRILWTCVLVLLFAACGSDAATALAMPTSGGTPNSVETTIDRPFIFAIQERETGAILFLGRVTDPS